MLIEELIEKAFCDGYEYAQKEFAINPQQANGISKSAKKLARQNYWRSVGRQTINPENIAYAAKVNKISIPSAEVAAGRISQNEVLKKSPRVTVNDRIGWRTSNEPMHRSLADPMRSKAVFSNGERVGTKDYHSAQRLRDRGVL